MLKSEKRGNPVSNGTSETRSPSGECDGLHWLDLRTDGERRIFPFMASCILRSIKLWLQYLCSGDSDPNKWENPNENNHLRCVTVPSRICNAFCTCDSHLHTDSIGRILFIQVLSRKIPVGSGLMSCPLWIHFLQTWWGWRLRMKLTAALQDPLEQCHGVSGCKDHNPISLSFRKDLRLRNNL